MKSEEDVYSIEDKRKMYYVLCEKPYYNILLLVLKAMWNWNYSITNNWYCVIEIENDNETSVYTMKKKLLKETNYEYIDNVLKRAMIWLCREKANVNE